VSDASETSNRNLKPKLFISSVISPKNVPDPGSEIQKNFFPDPEGNKALDLGSATPLINKAFLK
jgi:hypothetical protein